MITIDNKIKYFLLGAVAVSFLLPLLSSLLELILGAVEGIKALMALKVNSIAEELESEGENAQPAIGFSIPTEEEDLENDDI